MPALPWTATSAVAALEPTTAVTIMASEFRLISLAAVPRFLADALRIRRQVLAADGAYGVALDAHPFHRLFRTLSAWRDRDAIDAMIAREPHGSAARRHHPTMADARFVFWEMPASRLPPGWAEAISRLHPSDQRLDGRGDQRT